MKASDLLEEKKPTVKVIQSSFPICTFTFVVLLVLKLTKLVEIGWWWVFAPFWIPLGIVIGCGIIFLVVIGVMALVQTIKEKVK